MYGQFRPPGGAPGGAGGFGGPPPPAYASGYQPGGLGGQQHHQFGGAAPGGGSFGQQHAGGSAHADDKLAKVKDPLLTTIKWLKDRSPQEKLVLGVVGALVLLLVLWRCGAQRTAACLPALGGS